LELALPQTGIENEKGSHSVRAALKSAWLVIHSPLVAHVALKVFPVGKVQLGDLLKNAINRRLYCGLLLYCFDVTDDCSEN